MDAIHEEKQSLDAMLPHTYADTTKSMYTLAESALLNNIEKLEHCLMNLHENEMKSKGVCLFNFKYSELMKEMSYKLMR